MSHVDCEHAEQAFGGLRPQLLGEGDGTLFLFKPPGMTVFPSRMHPERPCLLAFLLQIRPEQWSVPWPEGFEGGILHRLDTATSGLIVVATGLSHFERLRGLFSARSLKKSYLLLSAGEVAEETPKWGESWPVSVELAHHKKNSRKMIAHRGVRTPHRGRWFEAETLFYSLGSKGGVGLYRAEMRTGVTHQIRLHGATIGIPILGDTLYKGAEAAGPAPEAGFYLHHETIEGLGPCPRAPLPGSWGKHLPEGWGSEGEA